MSLARTTVLIGTVVFTYALSTLDIAAKTFPSVCAAEHCVAMVDAGSTGSRLHLFAYDTQALHQVTTIHEVYSNKIEPGLASLDLDQSTINAYLARLMRDLPQAKIPVYVYATAGMRLRSRDAQQHYYAMIQQWFTQQPQWFLRDARTITGKEEATFGWLALNYYLKTLDPGAHKPFANLIEVGGASAQIAFPINDETGMDPNDLQELTINDHSILLFAHGFLGLGANEVYKLANNQQACFPIGLPLANGTFGAGNADVCQAKLGEMAGGKYHVTEVTQQALSKNTGDQWYTVSAVSGMISRAPFVFTSGSFSPRELLQQADNQLCQQDYESLANRFTQNEYIQRNCLIASYFYGLVVHGYEFSPDQDIHYLPTYDADWTIGALLFQSDKGR